MAGIIDGPDRALSLSYYTVPELSASEMIRVAAQAGCVHVGLRLLAGQPDGEMLPAMTDAGERRAIRAALDQTGLSALDANTARLVPSTRVAAFDRFLDVAAELGTRHILATADDPEPARLHANLEALCNNAATRGMTVEFEFVPWMPVGDVAAAARLLGDVAHPALGIAVDALHVDRSNSRLEDLASIPANKLRYIHLCDAPPAKPEGRDALLAEAVYERLPPCEGALDLVGLLRAVPGHIPLALEVPTRRLAATQPALERVRRAVAGTRALLGQLGPL